MAPSAAVERAATLIRPRLLRRQRERRQFGSPPPSIRALASVHSRHRPRSRASRTRPRRRLRKTRQKAAAAAPPEKLVHHLSFRRHQDRSRDQHHDVAERKVERRDRPSELRRHRVAAPSAREQRWRGGGRAPPPRSLRSRPSPPLPAGGGVRLASTTRYPDQRMLAEGGSSRFFFDTTRKVRGGRHQCHLRAIQEIEESYHRSIAPPQCISNWLPEPWLSIRRRRSTSSHNASARHARAPRRCPPHRIVAPPPRPRERRQFAALRVDQDRRRHAECLADQLEVLKHLGVLVGVVGKPGDANLLEPCLIIFKKFS